MDTYMYQVITVTGSSLKDQTVETVELNGTGILSRYAPITLSDAVHNGQFHAHFTLLGKSVFVSPLYPVFADTGISIEDMLALDSVGKSKVVDKSFVVRQKGKSRRRTGNL
jgi:hypothetical protein